MIEEKDPFEPGWDGSDIPEQIRGGDWWYAFAWSTGENRGTSSGGTLPEWAEGDEHKGTAEPFSRRDVAEVFAAVEGEGDGADWLAYGRLKDERFFFLSAGCDYTGWGCQDGGRAYVATTRERIETMVMTADERARLDESEDDDGA